ncbi:hypothetical protein IWX49DRAFT_285685 [Phyllosticta citricarpa]|uniref:Secreted protein n=2 Tax=Phyllosticta TaxID=121621 RepID=A0ABR1MLM5_9PEZI
MRLIAWPMSFETVSWMSMPCRMFATIFDQVWLGPIHPVVHKQVNGSTRAHASATRRLSGSVHGPQEIFVGRVPPWQSSWRGIYGRGPCEIEPKPALPSFSCRQSLARLVLFVSGHPTDGRSARGIVSRMSPGSCRQYLDTFSHSFPLHRQCDKLLPVGSNCHVDVLVLACCRQAFVSYGIEPPARSRCRQAQVTYDGMKD